MFDSRIPVKAQISLENLAIEQKLKAAVVLFAYSVLTLLSANQEGQTFYLS